MNTPHCETASTPNGSSVILFVCFFFFMITKLIMDVGFFSMIFLVISSFNFMFFLTSLFSFTLFILFLSLFYFSVLFILCCFIHFLSLLSSISHFFSFAYGDSARISKLLHTLSIYAIILFGPPWIVHLQI